MEGILKTAGIKINRVGIVGCGFMGSEIGYVCAKEGYTVIMSDLNQEIVDRGIGRIRSNLEHRVIKGTTNKDQMTACLNQISGTPFIKGLYDCDLVIEAIVEKIEAKREVFASLDRVCKKGAILATNTSSLSIIDIAAPTKRMEQVLGLHFFPPIELMPLLEISKSIATSGEVVKIAADFGESLGLKVIVTNDYPAFIVNNIVGPMMLQGVRLLEKGLASPEEIDQSVRTALGHPIGPLSLLDYVGLDVVLNMAKSVYEETKDMIWAPPLLLRKMVAAGWLGRKTGKGFYNYRRENEGT